MASIFGSACYRNLYIYICMGKEVEGVSSISLRLVQSGFGSGAYQIFNLKRNYDMICLHMGC